MKTIFATSSLSGVNPNTVWSQGDIFGKRRLFVSIIRGNSPFEMDAEDQYNVAIALKRLDEMRQSPEKMVKGEALEKKMKQWVS